jgi:hypothetical protein
LGFADRKAHRLPGGDGGAERKTMNNPNTNYREAIGQFGAAPLLDDDRFKFTNEFDRLHGTTFNWKTMRYERPILMQLAYFCRRAFRHKRLIQSEKRESFEEHARNWW